MSRHAKFVSPKTGLTDWGAVLEGFRQADIVAIDVVTAVAAGTLARRGVPRDSRADLVQETIARVWRQRDQIRAIVPYTRRVAFSTYKEWLSKVTDDGRDAETAADPAQLKGDIVDLERCLELLPQQPRLILLSLYVEGLTRAEAAARYQIPIGTLNRVTAEAKRQLRECLGL